MGFGLLFIGYTFMLTVGMQINPDLSLIWGLDALPDVIGYILFLFGLRNLRPYSKNFVFAWWLTIPLIAIGAVILGAELISLAGFWQTEIDGLLSLILNIHYPVLIIFHIYLCLGIKDLASEVGLPKIVRRSYTAMLLVVLRYLMEMVMPRATAYPLIAMIYALVPYIVYFYMLYFLYSCYARIIYADEEPKSFPNPLMKLLEKKQSKK